MSAVELAYAFALIACGLLLGVSLWLLAVAIFAGKNPSSRG